VKHNLIWRVIGAIGTVTCAVIFARHPSFPTPDKLVVFIIFVAMMFNQALEAVKRFVPFVALLLVYESFRGLATHLNKHVHYTFMANFDKILGFGRLPTARLQDWWWHGTVQWYDFLFYLVYMLHFVLPLGLAVIVWKTRDKLYWRYVTSFVVLSFAGFITYVLYPAAPPWMASDKGLIEPITRVSSYVWGALGIQDFPSVYNKISPNPVAAVPSLHAAYATLIALIVTRWFTWKYRWLIWMYPMLMYLGTIYMGEHYLFDALLGSLYAVVAYLVSPWVLQQIKVGMKKLLSSK
jgi:membrane-associated phospholipid phosphatase